MIDIEKWRRVERLKALETLCAEMPDCDKHFLAERLLSYGSSGSGVVPLTVEDFRAAKV